MFTEAFLQAIKTGTTKQPELMSLSAIEHLIKDYLEDRYPDKAKAQPETHDPDQSEGHVSDVGLFPNPLVQSFASPQWVATPNDYVIEQGFVESDNYQEQQTYAVSPPDDYAEDYYSVDNNLLVNIRTVIRNIFWDSFLARRFIAGCIDIFLIGFYSFCLQYLIKDKTLYYLLSNLFIPVYLVAIPYLFRGSTIGMVMRNLKIIDENNHKPNIKILIIRHILAFFSLYVVIVINNRETAWLLFVNIIIIFGSAFFDPQKRGFPDRLTRTYIVNRYSQVNENEDSDNL
jgi:uncharacterized RDD family membrane protein YckC